MTTLAGQTAITIQNARLFRNQEEQVVRRTAELNQANAKLQESYEEVKRMARIDYLTQLSNRRDFNEKIQHEKATADIEAVEGIGA